MAWGGLIFRTPPDATLDSLPQDYSLPSLGSPSDVRHELETLLPDQTHTEGQSCIDGGGFWIELNYGSEPSIDSIGVRTNADENALTILQTACESLGARLFDNQTGDFADFSDATSSSMAAFRDFRDRNIPPSA